MSAENHTKYMIVVEWEYDTPTIIGWSTLDNAIECRDRIAQFSCKRIALFIHTVAGLYEEMKGQGYVRDPIIP